MNTEVHLNGFVGSLSVDHGASENRLPESKKITFVLTCTVSVINFKCVNSTNMFVKAVPVALSKQVGTKGCYRLIYKPDTSGVEPADCR